MAGFVGKRSQQEEEKKIEKEKALFSVSFCGLDLQKKNGRSVIR